LGERHSDYGSKGICLPGRQHRHHRRLRTVQKGGGAAGDAAAQWRIILANIKSDLEELGTSLDHLIKLTFFVKGPFPDGGVLSSPNFRQDVMDEFFARHCPKQCSYNNPPPSEVIGVAALAHPDLVIEIVAVAALPD
jgi:enamine deaminase RidA (YjgF/YER057c/UK114 family)